MLVSREDLKEMTGYTYDELGVQFTSQRVLFDLDRDDFQMLFERVRELSFEEGQNNLLDCGYKL